MKIKRIGREKKGVATEGKRGWAKAWISNVSQRRNIKSQPQLCTNKPQPFLEQQAGCWVWMQDRTEPRAESSCEGAKVEKLKIKQDFCHLLWGIETKACPVSSVVCIGK